MKYAINLSISITPMRPPGDFQNSGTLYHSQNFEMEGARMSDIAPTIDGLYDAVRKVVEDHANSD